MVTEGPRSGLKTIAPSSFGERKRQQSQEVQSLGIQTWHALVLSPRLGCPKELHTDVEGAAPPLDIRDNLMAYIGVWVWEVWKLGRIVEI